MNITHKGSTIFYTDQGKGAPVVLLHGFLENSSMWDTFLPEFSKNHRIICIDLLGHGKSECIGYIHHMQDFSAAIYQVIKELKLEEITIIGHSMGGYVGLAFAKAYPEKLKALCLLNSTPEADTEDRKQLRIRASRMAKTQFEQLVRMSFVNLFDPTTKKIYTKEIELALNEALKTPIQGYIAANDGMRLRESSSQFWKTASFKKGMILGETDWIIQAQNQKEKFATHLQLFKIIKGGHMSHISNREQVLHLLLEFLSS